MSKTSLEKEFDDALRVHGAKIQQKLATAQKALTDKNASDVAAKAMKEASDLADKHGIPFHSKVVAIGNYVMPADNNYVPNTYFERYGSLNPDKVAELTQVAAFSLSKYDPEGGGNDYDESYQYDESYDESYFDEEY